MVTIIHTLLVTSNVPHHIWAEATCNVVHLISMLPILVLNLVTPYSLPFCLPFTYFHLHVFRCFCFPDLGPFVHNKLMIVPWNVSSQVVVSNIRGIVVFIQTLVWSMSQDMFYLTNDVFVLKFTFYAP